MRKTAKTKPHGKRYDEARAAGDRLTTHEPAEALALVKKTATAKFPETVDLAVRLGIDARQSDQNVRGITTLPHGTGKSRKVAVLAKLLDQLSAQGVKPRAIDLRFGERVTYE